MAVDVVFSLSARVISLLWQWKEDTNNNEIVGREVELFIKSLTGNVTHLKDMLPTKGSPWALESLQIDLDETAKYLDDCLKKGYVKKLWDSKKIGMELSQHRQRLVDAFHTKLFITNLEFAVEGDKKMENFQSKMLQLSAQNTALLRSEIRSLLQPVVEGRTPGEVDNIHSFIATYRELETDNNAESSTESQKFLADILANLEALTEAAMTGASENDHDREFYDPITFELMCDPVKCSDGYTYDRWTVIRNNSYNVQPLTIVCDDVSVRGRLYEKFPQEGLDKKCHFLRNEYRERALGLARESRDGEALTMLTHVLEWNESDPECRQICKQIRDRSSSSSITTHTKPQQAEIISPFERVWRGDLIAADRRSNPVQAEMISPYETVPQQHLQQSDRTDRGYPSKMDSSKMDTCSCKWFILWCPCITCYFCFCYIPYALTRRIPGLCTGGRRSTSGEREHWGGHWADQSSGTTLGANVGET